MSSFRQTFHESVEIGDGSSPAAVYRYAPKLPKPCIHPLRTPAGECISGFEMSDHAWHRGLWFTIKFVNESNFWEENAPFGVQVSQREPACELIDRESVRVAHLLGWTSEATGKVVAERRVITFRSLPNGVAAVDWETELHAQQDLTLDRTPYTTWGGYGGLAFRGARELHDVNFLLPNGDTAAALAGQQHEWTVMQASIDGGGPGRRVSIGLIDHPGNPRSPSPWYNKSSPGFSYLNPAFLFHEPMNLARGQALRLRYLVLWRDGEWTKDQFAALAKEFRGE
jgi:hypothetical protein